MEELLEMKEKFFDVVDWLLDAEAKLRVSIAFIFIMVEILYTSINLLECGDLEKRISVTTGRKQRWMKFRLLLLSISFRWWRKVRTVACWLLVGYDKKVGTNG